jgi:hypothetical protein
MRRAGPTKIREAHALCGRQDIFVLTFFVSFLVKPKKKKINVFIMGTNVFK